MTGIEDTEDIEIIEDIAKYADTAINRGCGEDNPYK
jgi:hypothetical protein